MCYVVLKFACIHESHVLRFVRYTKHPPFLCFYWIAMKPNLFIFFPHIIKLTSVNTYVCTSNFLEKWLRVLVLTSSPSSLSSRSAFSWLVKNVGPKCKKKHVLRFMETEGGRKVGVPWKRPCEILGSWLCRLCLKPYPMCAAAGHPTDPPATFLKKN